MSVDLDTPPQQGADLSHSPRRVLDRSFSGTGVAVAAFFFAVSVLPSLLPRAGYVQGVVSGITLMIGYGVGAGGQWLWEFLQVPKPIGRTRTIVVGVLIVLIGWAAVFSAWRQVGWQNEIRTPVWCSRSP